MTTLLGTVTSRLGYVNTLSERGSPSRIVFSTNDVIRIRSWCNGLGNPSYCFHLEDGRTILSVDNYGGLNDITHVTCQSVKRKRDLLKV
jgi:hypothetical protein